MMGTSSLVYIFNNEVGIGSRLHVVDGDFNIMLLTSSSDIISKLDSETDESACVSGTLFTWKLFMEIDWTLFYAAKAS